MKTKHIIIGIIAVVAIYFLFFRGKKKDKLTDAEIKKRIDRIDRDHKQAKKDCGKYIAWQASAKHDDLVTEYNGELVTFADVKAGKYPELCEIKETTNESK